MSMGVGGRGGAMMAGVCVLEPPVEEGRGEREEDQVCDHDHYQVGGRVSMGVCGSCMMRGCWWGEWARWGGEGGWMTG